MSNYQCHMILSIDILQEKPTKEDEEQTPFFKYNKRIEYQLYNNGPLYIVISTLDLGVC